MTLVRRARRHSVKATSLSHSDGQHRTAVLGLTVLGAQRGTSMSSSAQGACLRDHTWGISTPQPCLENAEDSANRLPCPENAEDSANRLPQALTRNRGGPGPEASGTYL